MSMENMNMFESLVVTIICALSIVLLLAVYVWAKGFMGEVETRGSSVALAGKTLVAPCIWTTNMKGDPEKFIFEKDVLTRYNNSALPPACLDLRGSYYFVEVKTADDMWYFTNAPSKLYAHNTIARGWTMNCISNFPFDKAAPMAAKYPIPFDYNYNNYNGGIISHSANVVDGESVRAALVRIIIDPDAGTTYYSNGFPLCLKDVPCPVGVEQGKCDCIKEKIVIPADGVATCGV